MLHPLPETQPWDRVAPYAGLSWCLRYALFLLPAFRDSTALLAALFFYFPRQTYGFAFSAFWFFENFLYIGTYMKDARAETLPLVNGDIGDWTLLFGQWRLLDS